MKKLYAFLLLAITFLGSINAQVTKLYSNVGGVAGTLGNKVPFIGSLGGIGATDGTLAGTAIVVSPATVSFQFNSATAFWNSKILFVGNTAAYGNEIWVSDLTAGGTMLLKDINPGTTGSNPSGSTHNKTFPVIGNTVFFIADDGTHGPELWKTDGTTAGTVLLKDINPGSAGSNIQFSHPESNNYVNTLYFTADDGVHGQELWKSDGTPAGTVLVADITAGSTSTIFSNDFTIASVGTTAYFIADDGIHGAELWRTDGTAGGTFLLKDINAGSGAAFSLDNNFNYFVFGSQLVFSANTNTFNYGMWITDGTTANTTVLNSNLNPSLGFYQSSAVILNGKFYFSSGSNTGVGIWQSDGTPGGTQLFKDFSFGSIPNPNVLLPGINNSDGASQFLFQGNKFFFTAYDGVSKGYQLWVTDGTAVGTKILTINPNGNAIDTSQNNNAYWFFTQDHLFLSANDGVHGYELWKSDGTAAGTVMVQDLNPGSASSSPGFGGVASGNTLVFSATDNAASTNLYKVDAAVTELPMLLGTFTAQLKGNDALLNWNTLQETNIAYFNIQRSVDGASFTTIGSVKAAGNSAIPVNYSYNDVSAATLGANKLYYRLQVGDKDGHISFSKMVPVNIVAINTPSFIITPNPSTAVIALQCANINGKVNIQITNMEGRVLQNFVQIAVAGQRIPLAIKKMASGIYIVTLNYHGMVLQQRFIKQ